MTIIPGKSAASDLNGYRAPRKIHCSSCPRTDSHPVDDSRCVRFRVLAPPFPEIIGSMPPDINLTFLFGDRCATEA